MHKLTGFVPCSYSLTLRDESIEIAEVWQRFMQTAQACIAPVHKCTHNRLSFSTLNLFSSYLLQWWIMKFLYGCDACRAPGNMESLLLPVSQSSSWWPGKGLTIPWLKEHFYTTQLHGTVESFWVMRGSLMYGYARQGHSDVIAKTSYGHFYKRAVGA